MSKRLMALLVAGLMTASVFTACTKPTDKPEDKTPVTEEKTDKEDTKEKEETEDTATEGEIVFRMTGGKAKTLNPHNFEQSAEGDVNVLIYGNFLDIIYDQERDSFTFQPNFAEALPTKNEDGTVWTFKMKKDLQWPDGSPITAEDIMYSYKMLLDPKLKNFRGAEAFFSGDIAIVNAKKYWTGYAADNIKLQEQKEEEAALEKLQKEIEAMEDGEEKDKKQAEYDERYAALQADYIDVSDEDLAEGGAKWEDVGIKAPDDYTIEITLEYPVPDVDFYISFSQGGSTSPVREELYEAGMNEDRTETDYGTAMGKMDYSGPYILTKWERDQYREYIKNDKSPLKDIYTPEKITERVIEDANTALQLFENGETDTVGLSGANYEKYEEDPRLVFSKSDSVWQMFINMTSEDPEKAFLTDVNFRKAMYWGMNRESIAKDIYKTAIQQPCIIADTRTVDPIKGTTFRETEVGKANYPENDGYDPEKAKEFFDKAYEKFGKKMVVDIMYFDNSDNMKATAEFLEQEYENMFGADRIDVKLRAVPWQNAYDNMQNGDYDMGFGAWTGGIFNPWSGMMVYTQEFGIKCDQFRSDEFDELFRRTVKGDLIFKPEERLAALGEMEKMLLDNVPMVPMYQATNARLYQDRIHLLTHEWRPGVGFAPFQAEIDPLQ
ncbi:MAG: ABC transporter substrate-binding protein [Ezakiella sp.]|nr:ABC transporter substrate-binding protein [Ezakiella sp.]